MAKKKHKMHKQEGAINMRSKIDSTCNYCGKSISKGDWINFFPKTKKRNPHAEHSACSTRRRMSSVRESRARIYPLRG